MLLLLSCRHISDIYSTLLKPHFNPKLLQMLIVLSPVCGTEKKNFVKLKQVPLLDCDFNIMDTTHKTS